MPDLHPRVSFVEGYAPGWGISTGVSPEDNPERPVYALHLPIQDRETIPFLLAPLLLSSVVIGADGGDDWEEWCEPWKGEDNPAALHILFWVPDGIGYGPVGIAESLLKGLRQDLLALNVPVSDENTDPAWRSKAALTDGRDWSKPPYIP